MCIGAEKSAIESKCGVSTGKAETDNFNLNRNMSAIQVKIKSTLIQHVPPYVLPWMLPVVLRLINCCLPGITFVNSQSKCHLAAKVAFNKKNQGF